MYATYIFGVYFLKRTDTLFLVLQRIRVAICTIGLGPVFLHCVVWQRLLVTYNNPKPANQQAQGPIGRGRGRFKKPK